MLKTQPIVPTSVFLNYSFLDQMFFCGRILEQDLGLQRQTHLTFLNWGPEILACLLGGGQLGDDSFHFEININNNTWCTPHCQRGLRPMIFSKLHLYPVYDMMNMNDISSSLLVAKYVTLHPFILQTEGHLANRQLHYTVWDNLNHAGTLYSRHRDAWLTLHSLG